MGGAVMGLPLVGPRVVGWCSALIVLCGASSCSQAELVSPAAVDEPASNPLLASAAGKERSASAATSSVVHSSVGGPLLVGEPELVSTHSRDLETRGDPWFPSQIVVGWGGQVTAVWFRWAPGNQDARGRLMASQRHSDGTWSRPKPVSGEFSMNRSTFDVAAGTPGHVSVVWTKGRRDTQRIYEAHLVRGTWTSPTRIGRGYAPKVAVDGQGQTSVLWFRVGEGMFLAARGPESPWVVRRLPGRSYGYMDIVADRAGNEVALWAQGSDGRHPASSYRSASSRVWSDAQTVPGQPFFDVPGLALFGAGQALAAWTVGQGNHTKVLWTRRDTASGRWSPTRRVPGEVGSIDEVGTLLLAVDPVRSQGIALWVAEGTEWGEYTSRWAAATGFAHAKPVVGLGVAAMSMNPDGTVLAVGRRYTKGVPSLVYRWQKPGERWSRVQELGARGADLMLGSVASRDGRTATLYGDNKGVHVIVIDGRS
ncbi:MULTISPECIES: hypothetical protein [unclassified Nocardioides]|uniref:hypothetical protein n=1 Tax=unclassified Nocardioides TaxID=2615069 RepID=UPI003620223C